jgi:hypothetical protein
MQLKDILCLSSSKIFNQRNLLKPMKSLLNMSNLNNETNYVLEVAFLKFYRTSKVGVFLKKTASFLTTLYIHIVTT